MHTKLLLFSLLFYQFAFAQPHYVGVFQYHEDIGKPKNRGSSTYDKDTKTYKITGSGYNIWFKRDEFQYLYNKMKGDFVLTANFEFLGNTGNGHRKIGWMIRESTDDGSPHYSAVAHGDGLVVMQWRVSKNAAMRDPEDEIFYPKKGVVEVIQLERVGKKITMRVAKKGEKLQEVGSHEAPDMPDDVLAGVYICSHDSATIEAAKIWNVSITKR